MPHPNQTCAVRHPATGGMVALDPGRDYDQGDPLVKAYPWAFKPLENAGQIIESVVIEQATADPGQKRNRSRK